MADNMELQSEDIEEMEEFDWDYFYSEEEYYDDR